VSETLARTGRAARAWAVLGGVLDPEVPALSVRDLGIVRDVIDPADAPSDVPAVVPGGGVAGEVDGEGRGVLEIVLTPTYSGCPATEVISQDCLAAIDAAGLGPARVTLRRAPAWSSDWISEEGRRKLLEYGIAPPGAAHLANVANVANLGEGVPMRFVRRRVAPALNCPRCGSALTEQLSAFGSTACKSLHRCIACREPFEHFKPI
jgi:ring-1,2-phenylacetyl-CoA epoxidase subunit PaaD